MDTETPPDPRGVPAETAVLTLTAPELAAAFLAARDTPISEAEIAAEISARARKAPGAYIPSHVAKELRGKRFQAASDALLADFLAGLRAGRILCAGRERGAGAANRCTFAPSDWRVGAVLRMGDWRDPSARINGRVYGELVFWGHAEHAHIAAAPCLCTASAMPKTDTPPASRGEPAETAIFTLTAPELVAAFNAARERGGKDMGPAEAALTEDFCQRVRDGRIVASWVDLERPELGAAPYPAESAALIRWYRGAPKLRADGPVLADLRYRRAGRVLPRSEMRRLLDQSQGFPEAPDLPAACWVPPVPPPEGWSALEAAAALWPALIIMAERDPDRRPASAQMFAPPKREMCFRVFANDLLDHLILPRDDLVITGRRFSIGPEAGRVPLSPDYHPDRRPAGIQLHLDILAGSLTIGLPGGEDQQLEAVRIERATPLSAPAPPAISEPMQGALAATPHADAAPNPVNRGGRPQDFNRMKIAAQLIKIADLDSLPDDVRGKRELVRRIATEVAGREPSDSVLAEIMKDLDLR